MTKPAISPRTYSKLAWASALLLLLIIATGAAVRLSGSGLGCTDWPKCSKTSLVSGASVGSKIEFGNRVVTALCLAVASLCVLGAYFRVPFRKDLTRLGVLVTVLLFSNAIVGGAVVLLHLKTGVVAAHFLLALATLTVGLNLAFRSTERDDGGPLSGATRHYPNEGAKMATRIATGAILIAIVLGTVVTGSGPNSGDPAKRERLKIAIQTAARIHSGGVWLALLSVVVLGYLARHNAEQRKRVIVLIAAMCLQGAIGYTQYALGLPGGLVEVHVIMATFVWTALIWMRHAMAQPKLPELSIAQ